MTPPAPSAGQHEGLCVGAARARRWPRRANLPGDCAEGNVLRLTGSLRGRTLPTGGPASQATTTPESMDAGRADRGDHACRTAAPDGN